jgi:hypothetical protein
MPGGRWALSGSTDQTARLWDLWAKREAAAFRKHTAPVLATVFLANGTQTLTGDRDLGLLPWKIDRFLAAEPPKPRVPEKIPYAKP